MARKRSATELEHLRREFAARAEAAFEQMFGADGQNGLVTFTEREDRACEVTDALARWLLEEHLALDKAADLDETGAALVSAILTERKTTTILIASPNDLPASLTTKTYRLVAGNGAGMSVD